MTPRDQLLAEYDPNGDGVIEKADMRKAVAKFFKDPPDLLERRCGSKVTAARNFLQMIRGIIVGPFYLGITAGFSSNECNRFPGLQVVT